MITLRLAADPPPEAWTYRVAGQRVVCDIDLPWLAAEGYSPWRDPVVGAHPDGAHPDGTHPDGTHPSSTALDDARELVYHGPGEVGGRSHQVLMKLGPDGYRLEILGLGVFHVCRDGRAVIRRKGFGDPQALLDAALGPGLVLALALQGTFCLHASAALLAGRLIAILGPSGAGKSTLAAFLEDGVGMEHFARAADDLLPVASQQLGGEMAAVALPHFPQPKLARRAQYPSSAPPRVALGGAVRLVEASRVTSRRLDGGDAVIELVRSTVAARLFDRGLLARHLAACHELAARAPVFELGLPRCLEKLPEVSRQLVALFSESPRSGMIAAP